MNKKNLSKEQLFEMFKQYDDTTPYAQEIGVIGSRTLFDNLYDYMIRSDFYTRRAYEMYKFFTGDELPILDSSELETANKILAENETKRNHFIDFDLFCKVFLKLK